MRLIDADALIAQMEADAEQMEDQIAIMFTYAAINDVKHAPTIEERKTGKWQITDAYPHNVYCSVCHKRFAQTHWAVWEDGSLPRNFCPNCGAKMEGEQP